MILFRRATLCWLQLLCVAGISCQAALALKGTISNEIQDSSVPGSVNTIQMLYAFEVFRDGPNWRLDVRSHDNDPMSLRDPRPRMAIRAGFDGVNTYLLKYLPKDPNIRSGCIFSGPLPSFRNTASDLLWIAFCSDSSTISNEMPRFWEPPEREYLPLPKTSSAILKYDTISPFLGEANLAAGFGLWQKRPKCHYEVTQWGALESGVRYPLRAECWVDWGASPKAGITVWKIEVAAAAETQPSTYPPDFTGILAVADVRKGVFYKAGMQLNYQVTNRWLSEHSEFVQHQAILWKAAGNPKSGFNSETRIIVSIAFIGIIAVVGGIGSAIYIGRKYT